jgi:hypothetical protein
MGEIRGSIRALSIGTALALATSSMALEVPGGRNPRTDCYARLDVEGVSAATSTRVAECTDGDPSCDQDQSANGSCQFRVRLCLNRQDNRPTCIPPAPPSALVKVKPQGVLKRLGLQVPALDSTECGPFLDGVTVKLRHKGKRPGRVKARVISVSPVKPKRDRDVVTLVCNPPGTAEVPTCAANPAGGPDQILLDVAAAGTDLDNGWKGPSFNFPTPAGTKLLMCAADCNDGTSGTPNPVCTTHVLTGPGSFNKNNFGPPLPLFAAGVPVCVVNEYQPNQPSLAGTANAQTGEINGEIDLFSHVFLTEEEKVCPKCLNSRCDSGPNQGGSCVVDGTVTVAESTAANKTFPLSKDCPPPNNTPAGTLNIKLPLTTGTSTLAPLPGGSAQTPCVAQPGEPRLVTPAADLCGAGGTCVAGGCSGSQTCASMGTDPVTGNPVCVDAKGGLSQYCCSSDPTRPCQPTRDGTPIARTGKPGAPVDSSGMGYGQGTYPKTGDVVTVATFCEPGTGTGSVDGLTGLPGPGALILPSTATWSRGQATP